MTKVEQLAALLPDDVDGALVTSVCNRRYLTGFPSSDGYVLVTRDAACFMTDSRYIEAARRVVRGMDCRVYSKASDALNTLIQKHNLHRLIVEDEGLSCAEYARLDSALENVELKGGVLDGLLTSMRLVKTPEELEKIKQAQALTDYGFEKILPRIHAGLTEREVALDLEFIIRKQGAECVAFEYIVVSGANSSLPHGVPSDKVIENGDFLTMDFGAVVDGWHSDMTRTIAVGSCSQEQRDIYEIVRKAQLTSLATLREGVSCVDADEAARRVIDEAGYGLYFGHGTGHGVGIEIHEAPRLSPSAQGQVLQEGNVVTVEPGIYLPEKFGVRIEDFAYITKTGCENLTKSPKELIVVE